VTAKNIKKCEGCENLIQLPSNKNYCSLNCYNKNYKKKWYLKNKNIHKKEEKNCNFCGNVFITKTKLSKYCSNKCNSSDFYKKSGGYAELNEKICEYCNIIFKPKKGKNTKCCSGLCNSKLWVKNNTERAKEMKRNQEKKRKELNKEDFLEKKRINSKKNSKWSYIKRKYNLTKEDYYKMFELQNNRCKICNNILGSGKKVHIDHCHVTSKVRGLLCQKCNHGLGIFNDNIQLFYNAIQYLQQNK